MSKKLLIILIKLIIVSAACSLIFMICLVLYTTGTPVHSVSYMADNTSQADTLIVFLPGFIDEPEDFVKAGFIDILKEHELKADVLITDAHPGYYFRLSLIDRLKADVIIPAKKKGYRDIWLVGFSMGGFGSLLYASKEPDDIKGILSIAPVLGNSDCISEISSSGGLEKWQPEEPLFILDFQRPLWIWLKEHVRPPGRDPILFLGYSVDDIEIIKSNNLLADVLPENQVFKVYGGHEWEPWRQIFSMFIDSIYSMERNDEKKSLLSKP